MMDHQKNVLWTDRRTHRPTDRPTDRPAVAISQRIRLNGRLNVRLNQWKIPVLTFDHKWRTGSGGINGNNQRYLTYISRSSISRMMLNQYMVQTNICTHGETVISLKQLYSTVFVFSLSLSFAGDFSSFQIRAEAKLRWQDQWTTKSRVKGSLYFKYKRRKRLKVMSPSNQTLYTIYSASRVPL